MKQYLSPSIDDLRLECVLMQAWKKTSAYLRSHSWYADTLGLDYQSLRIPHFLKEIQERLQNPNGWTPGPLEFVPAPKSQKWGFRKGTWEPYEKNISKKIRPLAHIALQDQVVATALLLCLADRVETVLGDPRLPIDRINQWKVSVYGHRLFCDRVSDELKHRWGTSKLYRQYFIDYQTFLKRPKIVIEQISLDSSFEIAIVQSDLSKFYDRVRPAMLHGKLKKFMHSADEQDFFNLAERVLNWSWTETSRALKYANLHNIENFDSIALPQGLVASGFFANIALADFESAVRSSQGKAISPEDDVILQDACYYVDDIRLVLRINQGMDEEEVRVRVLNWLQNLLNENAPGLMVEKNKTTVTVEGRERRFLVEQSKIADRIQNAVSGPFDMLHGSDIVGAIEGFFHTQKRYSSELDPEETGRTGLLIGTSDMRDDTAARFAAGKFRRTFRSLRPLLGEVHACKIPSNDGRDHEDDGCVLPAKLLLSRQQLDERAKLFAALLIEEWTANPGNVRLLRIALDIYPETGFLEQILSVLKPGWHINGVRGARREVRAYCLSEIFRAGATETGIVADDECLPAGVSLESYHERLIGEAHSLISQFLSSSSPTHRFPWYLMQQVLLYMVARNTMPISLSRLGEKGGKLIAQYRKFIKFLGAQIPMPLEERSLFLTMAYSSFGFSDISSLIPGSSISEELLFRLFEISPSIAIALWSGLAQEDKDRLSQMAGKIGIGASVDLQSQETTLADLSVQLENPFFEEENLLSLADWLFNHFSEASVDVLTPWHIKCAISPEKGYRFGKIEQASYGFLKGVHKVTGQFAPPDWCESEEERQKVQIGQLLRSALRGTNDFLSNFKAKSQKSISRYRRPVSHWEQQRYSSFQGRSAFGPAWLPISSFTEDLLFELLRWPGSGILTPIKPLYQIKETVSIRLKQLRQRRGEFTSATFLEQSAPQPVCPPDEPWDRPLRIGIVQSVIPCLSDYKEHQDDPEFLNDKSFRERQRSHLAILMQGVIQMLRVRDTHQQQDRCDGRVIDLLVFPELAIHPQDIEPIILPFIRAHKCIMLFGQVYHKETCLPGAPLINTCLWMIPEWNAASGFQIHRIEQGKQHLAGDEAGIPGLIGFRPSQWLIQYKWHSDMNRNRPLVISASICYDATDLALASDLRTRSDLYIVCALNRDVGTFDRMSEGLHFNMFQGIIVVNNGQFGGSSFFMPFRQAYHRQVFHLHGQPQATIAFAEINPRKLVDRPAEMKEAHPVGKWKTPPAGILSGMAN